MPRAESGTVAGQRRAERCVDTRLPLKCNFVGLDSGRDRAAQLTLQQTAETWCARSARTIAFGGS